MDREEPTLLSGVAISFIHDTRSNRVWLIRGRGKTHRPYVGFRHLCRMVTR